MEFIFKTCWAAELFKERNSKRNMKYSCFIEFKKHHKSQILLYNCPVNQNVSGHLS